MEKNDTAPQLMMENQLDWRVFPTEIGRPDTVHSGELLTDDGSPITEEQSFSLGEWLGKTHGSNQVLYGRDEEVRRLRECFERVKGGTGEGRPESVIVHGQPCTGKTQLVESALREYVANRSGRFVCGKFERVPTRGETFSALVSAFSDLCDLLAEASTYQPEGFNRADLKEQLGPNAEILTRLIPNLSYLVDLDTEAGEIDGFERVHQESEENIVLLIHSTRAFLRFFATPENPVVIFLDDVQWARPVNMDIILGLLTQADFHNVLLVLCFRDYPEANPMGWNNRVLMDALRDESALSSTFIHVRNLDLESIIFLVIDQRRVTINRARQIGQIVYERSQGNVYLALEALNHMRRHRVSPDEVEEDSWITEDSNDETTLSRISEMLLQKLSTLSHGMQRILQLASLLGIEFHVEILNVLVNSPHLLRDERQESDGSRRTRRQRIDSRLSQYLLKTRLDMAEREEMLRKLRGRSVYRFSHERIQQGFQHMVENKAKVQLDIGRTLKKQERRVYPDLKMQCLALAANNMNGGSSLITEDTERFRLVKLNLKMGRSAIEKPEFDRALDYYYCAQKALTSNNSSDVWEIQYDLCVETYQGIAYLEFCSGNHENCMEACNIVFGRAKTLHDKLRVCNISIASMGHHQEDQQEAIASALLVLTELGEKAARQPSQVMVTIELLRVRRLLKAKTDSDLCSLPLMTDKSKLAALEIMSKMSSFDIFNSKTRPILLIVALRMAYLTVRYGTSEWAPLAFALYGFVEISFNNVCESERYLELSARMIESGGVSKEASARALSVIFGLVAPWRSTYAVRDDRLDEVYRQATESTAFELALITRCQSSFVAFYAGVHLSIVESGMRVLDQQMRVFHTSSTYRRPLLPLWQCVLHFIGKCDDPHVLSGDAMNEGEYRKSLPNDPRTDPMAGFILLWAKVHIMLCFNGWCKEDGWSTMEELFYNLKDSKSHLPGHFVNHEMTFFRGLLACLLWHRTKERYCSMKARVYKRELNNCLQILEGWIKAGVFNCQPLLEMLLAEKLLVSVGRRNRKEVMAQYNKALDWCNYRDMLCWKALFRKRIFEVVSEYFRDPERSKEFLQDSIDLFNEWEAHGVATNLSTTYGQILYKESF